MGNFKELIERYEKVTGLTVEEHFCFRDLIVGFLDMIMRKYVPELVDKPMTQWSDEDMERFKNFWEDDYIAEVFSMMNE